MKIDLKIQAILLILYHSICFSELVRPFQGQELNYIHVLFEWEQEPDVTHYQIELIELSSNSTFIIDSLSTNLFIDRSNISWNRVYQWRVRSLLQSNEYGDWTEPAIFITKESKLHYVNITNYQDSLIQDGLTMVGGPNPIRHTVVIDRYGNEIWNDGEFSFKINHVDNYGAIYGNSDHLFPDYSASKINYDMDFLWRSDQEVDPHELKETSRNTFFTLKNIFSNGPIPSDVSMVDQFRDLGFLADDTTNEFPWYGQEIIEFDQDNNIIWSWDPFEHFSLDDHDRHGHTWEQAYMSMKYDWTHSNSIYFDEEESAIYLSSRHLSRITKIDYPSGDVIYNIGLPSDYIDSGDSCIGNELLFNFQHHIEKIGDNNFTLFDNGNISSLIFEHEQRISRALEYEVIGDSITNIVWEYQLAANLYGSAGGSMSILENDNRLIYTRANPGAMIRPTVLEVTKDKEIVWKMTGFETGSWYRVFRIPNIHPDRYSILFKNLKEINNLDSLTNVITIDRSNPQLVFKIFNESAYAQFYKYKLLDLKGWFENIQDTVRINPGENLELSFNPNFSVGSQIDTIVNQFNLITLEIEPVYHSYNKKIFKFNLINSLIIPDHIKVYQNYPNPFNNTTTIRFDLQSDSHVDLIIYDVLGNKIKTLVNKIILSGQKSIQWNGMNNIGENVSSGIYFYKIRIGDYYRTNKMLFIK